jgi:hypothetical protein
LRLVISIYTSLGFKVTIILASNRFESMRGELADMGALIKIISWDDHVPTVVQYNHTIKDHV